MGERGRVSSHLGPKYCFYQPDWKASYFMGHLVE